MCFVDYNLSSADISSVEGVDSGLSLSVVWHFNKSKAFGSAGFTIGHDAG